MADVLFCSEKFLKEQTNISDNVQGKFITSSLREVQVINYKEIIGENLYNRLIALLQTPGAIDQPANAIYKALLDESQYFIAYNALVDICMKASYKVSNFGVTKTKDENLELASWSEIAGQREFYQSKADAHCYQLQNWLLRNRTSLPELTQSEANKIRSNLTSAASCGIWLGGARGKGYPVPRRPRGLNKYD